MSRKSELAKNSWGEVARFGGKFSPKRCLDKTLDSTSLHRAFNCLSKVIKVTLHNAGCWPASRSHADLFIYLGRSVAAQPWRRSSNGRIAVESQSNRSCNHCLTGCAVAQHCYNGDVSFLWEKWKLWPPVKSKPLNRLTQNLSGLITSTRWTFVPNLVNIRSRGTSGQRGEI